MAIIGTFMKNGKTSSAPSKRSQRQGQDRGSREGERQGARLSRPRKPNRAGRGLEEDIKRRARISVGQARRPGVPGPHLHLLSRCRGERQLCPHGPGAMATELAKCGAPLDRARRCCPGPFTGWRRTISSRSNNGTVADLPHARSMRQVHPNNRTRLNRASPGRPSIETAHTANANSRTSASNWLDD